MTMPIAWPRELCRQAWRQDSRQHVCKKNCVESQSCATGTAVSAADPVSQSVQFQRPLAIYPLQAKIDGSLILFALESCVHKLYYDVGVQVSLGRNTTKIEKNRCRVRFSSLTGALPTLIRGSLHADVITKSVHVRTQSKKTHVHRCFCLQWVNRQRSLKQSGAQDMRAERGQAS